MLPSWLSAFLRYCAAVVAAGASTVVVGTILSLVFSRGRSDFEGLKMIAGLGAVIAFPIIVVLGLTMILVSRSLGRSDHPLYWAIAAGVGAVPGIMLAEGLRTPSPSAVVWIGTAAIAGALVFRLVWRSQRTSTTGSTP